MTCFRSKQKYAFVAASLQFGSVQAATSIQFGEVKILPQLLPYALRADQRTRSSMMEYMPMELMTGQAPVMPIETTVTTWGALPWKEEMSREDLLAVQMQQLEGREDVIEVVRWQRDAWLWNKQQFDGKH